MDNQFSDNLKKIRKEHNLSQEQLADELGVSRQAVSKWESGAAYPEMDKIILLCKKFNINIDDLLHNDIKEVKGEDETKKKINNFIDGFLKFITDTINCFSSLDTKGKIKCIFEQLIIIFILFIASIIIHGVVGSFFETAISLLPRQLYYFLHHMLDSILSIVFFFGSIIIMIHIFKTRYLDYFLKAKTEVKEERQEEKKTTKVEKKKVAKEVKEEKTVSLKKEDEKIIIRDEKHSEYHFINSLFKVLIWIAKFIALWIGIGIATALVGLLVTFVLSFLIIKSGVFFFGLATMNLSGIFISILLLVLIFNFVFNRKTNKKNLIWGFILSIIVFGSGVGLTVLGSLNFKYAEANPELLKTETVEYEMNENTVIQERSVRDISYIPEERDNIKVEYTFNKNGILYTNKTENNYISAWVDYDNPMVFIKELIKMVNKNELNPLYSGVIEMKIYASESNIEKLENNWNQYRDYRRSNYDEYENKIEELENQKKEIENQLEELEEELDSRDE